MIKAILFDMDGVLISAKEWHYEALNKALNCFGYNITRDEHLTIYDGISTKEKLIKLGVPVALHEIISELKRLYTSEMVRIQVKPTYAKQTMLYRLKKKYKLGCGSNAQKYSVVEMLRLAGIDQYFDEIIGNDEGIPNKPDPAVYLELMRRLGVKPDECIIVEDNKYGIEAAKRSGAGVIEVRGDTEDVTLDLFKDLL